MLAHYFTVISAERMSKQLELNSNLPNPSFLLDELFATSTKRRTTFCTPRQSSTSLILARQCVYCRTDPLITNETFLVNYFQTEERIIDALLEYALEMLASFYSAICIKWDTACCYRASYLYNRRQYDEVLHLCEVILHNPDLQNDLKQYAYTNVLLFPPLDAFFDSDVQCLLGLHTLVWYLSPQNDYLRTLEFAQVYSHFVYFKKEPLSISTNYPDPANYHYSLGGHFLARYLKLRCLIDNEQPWMEVMHEFAATKRTRPFEHIIHRFVVQKLCKNRCNSRFPSRQ